MLVRFLFTLMSATILAGCAMTASVDRVAPSPGQKTAMDSGHEVLVSAHPRSIASLRNISDAPENSFALIRLVLKLQNAAESSRNIDLGESIKAYYNGTEVPILFGEDAQTVFEERQKAFVNSMMLVTALAQGVSAGATGATNVGNAVAAGGVFGEANNKVEEDAKVFEKILLNPRYTLSPGELVGGVFLVDIDSASDVDAGTLEVSMEDVGGQRHEFLFDIELL